MSWYDYIPSVPYQLGKGIYDKYKGSQQQDDANKQRQDEAVGNLNTQGAAASGFANEAQRNYGAMTQESQQVRDYLRGVAQGNNSVSAEQLRQGLAQNMAAQRSMAASASPQNQAMAARTAAMQMGRMGAGMSGQAALAGLQERRDAQSQLGQMIMGQRGQDVNAALGSRQTAAGAYGSVAGNTGQNTDEKRLQQLLDAGAGGLSAFAKLSDKRTKTDIDDGDKEANAAIDGLRAYTYRYKDPKNGADKEVGVMAQELESNGLKHTVMETPKGKMINGAALATANTAMISALGRRLSKIEKGGK